MTDKLNLQQVGKIFPGNGKQPLTALNDINFSIQNGEFVSLIGPTGCGKTTLLRIVAGLDTPTTGKVIVEGRPVNGINKIATLVFQQFSLFPWNTVMQNVIFPLEMKNMAKKAAVDRAKDLLAMVGLLHFKNAYPFELSGGMQQRVAIARALAFDPEILLMDEPFGALDVKTRHNLQKLLLHIWQQKQKTILFVTHNIDEAISLGDRVVIMASDPGRIIDEIKIEIPRPRNRLDAAFINYHLQLRQIIEVAE